MSRLLFGVLIGVILAFFLDSTGENIFGLFGVDLDSYLNYIISMKHWFAEFFPS